LFLFLLSTTVLVQAISVLVHMALLSGLPQSARVVAEITPLGGAEEWAAEASQMAVAQPAADRVMMEAAAAAADQAAIPARLVWQPFLQQAESLPDAERVQEEPAAAAEGRSPEDVYAENLPAADRIQVEPAVEQEHSPDVVYADEAPQPERVMAKKIGKGQLFFKTTITRRL
jgi:hypothetical protein